MKRIVLSVLAGLALCFPVVASARCYFTGSYGQGTFSRSYVEKLEEKILDQSYVQGEYTFNSHSHPDEFGGGCELGKYLSVEGHYFQGLQTEVTSVFALCASFDGKRVCSEPALMYRKATLEGRGVSLLGRAPLHEDFEAFLRVGVLDGVARVAVTIPKIAGDPALNLSIEEHGFLPMVGLGGSYRFNERVAGTCEYRVFDKHYSRVFLCGLRLSFN